MLTNANFGFEGDALLNVAGSAFWFGFGGFLGRVCWR